MAWIDRDELVGAEALVYARRSRPMPGQRQSESTIEQIEESLRDAERHGLIVRRVLADDGIGASKYSKVKVRTGYTTLLQEIAEDPPRVLVMWAQSRSTRRVKVAAELLDLCEEQGILLLIRGSLKDPSDPDDRLALTITAAGDEAEAGRTRRDTKRAMAGTAAKGKDHGQAPYGYMRMYGKHREIVATVQDPEQGPIVQEIVRRVLAGESSRAIADDLTAREIKRPYGATTWHRGEIRDMCLSPALRGYRAHHGSVTKAVWWEHRLISEQQADDLDRIFEQRLKQRGGWATAAKHPLAGLVICDKCDGPMYKQPRNGRQVEVSPAERRYAYVCPVKGCKRTRDAEHLESWMRETVNVLLENKDLLAALLAGEDNVDVESKQTDLDALQKELDGVLAGDYSAAVMAAQEKRLQPKIDKLTAEIRQATAEVSPKRVAAMAAERLPDDDVDARELMAALGLRVFCKASRRGNQFDYSSIELRAI